jgi:hypothetical protein
MPQLPAKEPAQPPAPENIKLPPLPEKIELPELPELPPKKLDTPLDAPAVDKPVSKLPELPELPQEKPDLSKLPPLPSLDNFKESKAELPSLDPSPVSIPAPEMPDLPPVESKNNTELPALPPLPSLSGLENTKDETPNKALEIAKKHTPAAGLPPLPETSETQIFVKEQEGGGNTGNPEQEVAMVDAADLPPLPVRHTEGLSPVDVVKSDGTPAASIEFSQMERAVPLSSYDDLRKIAETVKKDESKGVTIIAYAYGSDDQSQLAKRAALARMMSVRTFLIEEGGLEQSQINAMTPRGDAQADGKERVELFVR